MEKYISVDNIDSYYEQVVKRQMSSATVAKLVGGLVIILTAIVVSIVLMVTVADWLFPFVLMMVGLGGYLIYYLLKHSRVEYEYTFVLGELRIAKIKGRSKRRTITYFDVKNIDDLGRYVNQQTGKRNIDPSKYPNLLHAAVDDYRYDTYYFIIHDKVRKKPAVLLMTPNEKTFSLIRPYLSVELKKNFIGLFGLFCVSVIAMTFLIACYGSSLAVIIVTIAVMALYLPSFSCFIVNAAVYERMYEMVTNKNARSQKLDEKINAEKQKRIKQEQKDEFKQRLIEFEIDENVSDDEYIYFNGRMVKKRVLVKMKQEALESEE